MDSDPEVLENMAARLETRARAVTLAYGLVGLLVGLLLALLVGAEHGPFVLGVPVAGAVLGAVYGRARALDLRVRAHTLLRRLELLDLLEELGDHLAESRRG